MATSLSAQARDTTGSANAGRMRREGMVPGVLYDTPGKSIPFQVSGHELRLALVQGKGRENGLDLTIGDASPVSVKMVDWQLDPVRGDILHVDFQKA